MNISWIQRTSVLLIVLSFVCSGPLLGRLRFQEVFGQQQAYQKLNLAKWEQELATLKGLDSVKDKVLVYSTFYHHLEFKRDATPEENKPFIDLLEGVEPLLRNEMEEFYLEKFEAENGQPPTDEQRAKIEANAHDMFTRLFNLSPQIKLKRILDMEAKYLKSTEDKELLARRQTLFENVVDMAQQEMSMVQQLDVRRKKSRWEQLKTGAKYAALALLLVGGAAVAMRPGPPPPLGGLLGLSDKAYRALFAAPEQPEARGETLLSFVEQARANIQTWNLDSGRQNLDFDEQFWTLFNASADRATQGEGRRARHEYKKNALLLIFGDPEIYEKYRHQNNNS